MSGRKKVSIRMITVCAMGAALIALATFLLKIPGNMLIPGSYAHLGDSMIYILSLMLPPPLAALTSGIGSMMADLFAGSPAYMLPTLIIKAVTGLIVSIIVYKGAKTPLKLLIAILCASLWTVAGYFAYEAVIFGVANAVGSLLMNFMQVGFGMLIAYPVMLYLRSRIGEIV